MCKESAEVWSTFAGTHGHSMSRCTKMFLHIVLSVVRDIDVDPTVQALHENTSAMALDVQLLIKLHSLSCHFFS